MKFSVVPAFTLLLSACIVQTGTGGTGPGPNRPNSGGSGTGGTTPPLPAPTEIVGTTANWQPFPGAQVRVEVTLANGGTKVTSASAPFDGNGAFSIVLPAAAELATVLGPAAMQLRCDISPALPITTVAVPGTMAIVAVYNTAGNRTGILVSGDAPANLGEAPTGPRHTFVFAESAGRIGSCQSPTNLDAGWNLTMQTTPAGKPAELVRVAAPVPGKWYYLSQPGPGLVK